MTLPIWSVVTLFTELVVTGVVLWVIRTGYRDGNFLRKWAFGVLIYEVVFNISYMLSRSLSHKNEDIASEKTGEVALAIFHGIFSLFMFLSLIIFFLVAAKRYGQGENFFLGHRKLTVSFVIAWLISVFSGILFFVRLYLF